MRLYSIEDRVPFASLKYKPVSESVEYRKVSGKRLQNHRTAEVGREVWRSPHPMSCSQQTRPEQAAPGCDPAGFWVSPRMETP